MIIRHIQSNHSFSIMSFRDDTPSSTQDTGSGGSAAGAGEGAYPEFKVWEDVSEI